MLWGLRKIINVPENWKLHFLFSPGKAQYSASGYSILQSNRDGRFSEDVVTFATCENS